MNYTLTALDTSQIQSYIFGSNELRENLGASELALRATTLKAFETLGDGTRHNIDIVNEDQAQWRYLDSARIEDDSSALEAEVIYAGGGNTVILFGGPDHAQRARQFVYRLSRQLLDYAPGLILYAAHREYQWGDNLPATLNSAMERLAQLKGELPPSLPTLGLSVTAACSSTGLPANGAHPSPDKQNSPASRANREIIRKWATADAVAEARLRGLFNIGRFEWTRKLDEIGNIPGRDESFIAVVHADGNGMGKRIIQLNGGFAERFPDQPRAFIRAMRRLSMKLNDTASQALKNTVSALVHELQHRLDDDSLPRSERRLFHTDSEGKWRLPFRPIVFGGDDVTWVCAGVWGLALAHRYLLELEKLTLPGFEELLSEAGGLPEQEAQAIVKEWCQRGDLPASDTPFACAGVAIVKSHYPFFQAYTISEQLAKSAKKRVLHFEPTKAASAIDWHFTTTGLTGKLKQIRAREYLASERRPGNGRYNLVARPLMLDSAYDTWRDWSNFHLVWRQYKEVWYGSRNKMIALRDAMRSGPRAVEQFQRVERKGARLPLIDLPAGKAQLNGGWVMPTEDSDLAEEEIRCAYFDAVEVADLFVELPAVDKEGTQ
jgi:hypothetical protein